VSDLLKAAEVITGVMKERIGNLESSLVAMGQGLEQQMSVQAKAFEGLASEQAKRDERLHLRLSKLEGSLERRESIQAQAQSLAALERHLAENTKAIAQTAKALGALTAKKPEGTRLAKLGAMLLAALGLGLLAGWLWALSWLRVTELEQVKASTDARVLEEAKGLSDLGQMVMAKYERANPQERELLMKLLSEEGLKPDELERLKRLAKPPAR
jgi:hypothetical protein